MRARILNVDDHVAARYARTRYLRNGGFEVLEAGTGAEALRAAQQQKVDLVLLDINLPDVNGFEVCRQLRADPATARLPIIHLSAARIADQDVVSGLESGADSYLTEPVEPDVLIATVQSLLRAKKAEDAVLESNERLRRFAFSVAHELQEPLRTIKSYTQLLGARYKGKLDQDADEYIAFTVDGVGRMETLIRDMLTYSQVMERDIDLKPVDSVDVLSWALMELQVAIGESGTVVTHDNLPVVQGDGTRLAQLFRNLVGNAIKYRSQETPRIHLSAARTGDAWQFAVRDNGTGFEQKYAGNIFQLFKRLHGPERPGSGVGLAICKEIVEKHGGRIWAESAPGEGSTFYFTLPPASAESATA